MEKKIREAGLLLNPAAVKLNKGPLWGKRHGQILLYFLLVFFAYCFRTNLSVGIVAMTDPASSSNPNVPTYNWTDKGVVLSAFFWGYVLPQIPAGWLAGRFGPKWFLVGTMGVCSIAGLATPLMAHLLGSAGVILCRALQGLSQGFFSPSVHYLLSKWAPINERSRLGTFVYAASHIATVASMLLSGYMASSWYGWPLIFYSFSTCGLIWCIFFVFFGFNSPYEHSSISEEEKNYIQESLGNTEKPKRAPKTPWLKIFTSLPVWATLIAQCGYNYGYWTMLTQVPNYMSKVLHFDIESNSILCSVPYLTYWLLSLLASYVADFVINKKILTIGGTRKLFNTIGFVVPAIGFIALANVNIEDVTLLVILLNISISSSSAAMCGFLVNHLDIAPKYASTLMGIANGCSNIFSLLAPLAVQFIVTDETDASQWKIIFYIAAGINIIANLFFVICGSGEVQPWNEEDPKEKNAIPEENIPVP